MVRVKRGTTTKERHKKVLARAKGYTGRSSTSFRVAIERVEKGLQYAYRDRRRKKSDYQSLWIQRINSMCRQLGHSYSVFFHQLEQNHIALNRKMLSLLATQEPLTFISLNQLSSAKN